MDIEFYNTKISEAVVGEGKQAYQGHVNGIVTVKSADLVRKVVDSIKAPETVVANVANALASVIRDYTAGGYRIVWEGLFATAFAVEGAFDYEDDEFDPQRHKLVPTAYALKALRESAVDLNPVNVLPKVTTALFGAQDKTTKEQNCVTGTNTLLMHGKFLKINPANADEGVFLVPSSGEELKAELERCDQQTVDCHWATAPEPGTYRLEHRGRAGHGVNRSLVTASIAEFTVKAA